MVAEVLEPLTMVMLGALQVVVMSIARPRVWRLLRAGATLQVRVDAEGAEQALCGGD